MKKSKHIFASILMIALLFTNIPSMSYAATWDEINSNEVFLKQEGSTTCTLCAATMLLRRAALLSGNTDWRSITESRVRPVGWIEGVGLRYGFTYGGYSVAHGSLPTGNANVSTLISLLEQHPEGIVLYYQSADKKKQHAVLLTDYTDGQFYCADPYSSRPSGRIPLTSALYVSATNANYYWYINSPDIPGPNDSSSSSNFEYAINSVSGGNGSIYIWGWAFDRSNVNETLAIDIYVGGPAGSGIGCHSILANQFNSSVDDAYTGAGDYHGFEQSISVNDMGQQTVYIYAVNRSTGKNKLLGTYNVVISDPSRFCSAVDSVSGEDGNIFVKGWAFDELNPKSTLAIDVYIGGPAGSGVGCNSFYANKTRTDVGDVYPSAGNEHGFREYISTDLRGKQTVYIYAINKQTQSVCSLGTYTVYIKPEGTDAISNGTYVISSSLDDNAVFDISEASMKDGGNLMICQYNGGDNQKFEVTYLGNNRYKMIAKHSGKSLDVQDANTSSGANVQQCTPNGGTNQQWMLQDAGDGYYYIFSSMNGLCIDLADGSTANNNNIRMFDFNGSAAQKWKLTSVLDKVVMNDLENTSTGVKISWNALENAKSYQIARRTPSTEWSVLTKGITGTSYIDETAEEGVTYYYTVYGLNGNFGSSVSDETKSITCYRVPEDVSLTSLVNTAVGVRLRWNEVENADVYRIYRRTSEGSWELLSRHITGTTCIDKTAKTGKKYYYAVRAQNGNSISPGYDTKKSITCIREMGKVKINSLTDVGSGVNVKWDYLYGADTYRVYRKEAGGQWICLKTGIKRNTFTDTTAKKQNTYYYTVKPENGEVVGMEYDGSKSIAYGKTLGKVTLTSMENIKEGVHLSWNTVPGATTYRVIRRISGSEWEVIASGIKRPVYTDTTAEPEQKYYYAVLAENGDNLSGEFDSKRWIIYRK